MAEPVALVEQSGAVWLYGVVLPSCQSYFFSSLLNQHQALFRFSDRNNNKHPL
jgi:hypothetical protein